VCQSGARTAVEAKRVVNIDEWKQVRSQARTDSKWRLLRMQAWTEMIQDQMFHCGCGSALLRRGRNKASCENFAAKRIDHLIKK